MAGSRPDIQAGRAYVSLYVKNSKFLKGLSDARRRFSQFGSDMMSLGRQMVTASAGILAPLAGSIALASNFEEAFSKFSVVFGKSTEEMKAWADSFAAEVGRSKTQIVEFLAGTQDLLVPIGFEPGAATEFSKQITKLAVDLASFNNMADADTLRDLQAALTGSSEVMKKYGVIVNETAVKNRLLADSIDPNTATEQQKVMARLNIIMEDTTAAQGDAIRTSGSFANQMKKLKATISDTATEIGTALLPAVTKIVSSVSGFLKPLAKVISENKHLVVIIGAVGTAIGIAGATLIGLGAAFMGAGAIIGAVTTTVGLLLSPLGLLAIGAVAAGVAFFKFSDAGKSVARDMGELFGSLKDTFMNTFAGIRDAIMGGDLKLAGQIAMTGLKIAFAQGTDALLEAWDGFVPKIAETFIGAMKLVSDMWRDTQNTITKGVLKLGELLTDDSITRSGGPHMGVGDRRGIEELKTAIEKRKRLIEKARAEGNLGILGGLENQQRKDLERIEGLRAGRLTSNPKNPYTGALEQLEKDQAEEKQKSDEYWRERMESIPKAGAAGDVDKLQSELEDLRWRALQLRKAADEEGMGGGGGTAGEGGSGGGGAGSVGGRASVATFSGAAAIALGQGATGSNPFVRMQKETKDEVSKQTKLQRLDAAMMRADLSNLGLHHA